MAITAGIPFDEVEEEEDYDNQRSEQDSQAGLTSRRLLIQSRFGN